MHLGSRSARNLLTLLACAAWIAATAAPAAIGAAVTVVASADTEGHVRACQFCSEGAGDGGLARRATIVNALRAQDPGLVLVDAGNVWFGGDAAFSDGRAIDAAYEALRYDAVNLGYRDFREGKAATLALLKDAKVPVVSANLLDADGGGKPIARPYVVKRVGDVRVALVGVTAAPDLVLLPRLAAQLKGVTVQPPAEALAAWLPRARAESDRVVLLYYGSARDLRPLLARFGSELAAVAAGGVRAGEMPENGALPVLIGAAHGTSLAKVALGNGARPEQVRVAADVAPDPAMTALAARFEPATPPDVPAPARPAQSPAPQVATAADAALTPGTSRPVSASAHNDAVELTVKSVALLDLFGEARPAAGKHFLVLDIAFRNIQMPRQVGGQPAKVQYKVPHLSDHLYAVADGRTVLQRSKAEAAGLLSFGELFLDKEGDAAGGKILYEVPADALPKQLTLRHYDFANGHIVLPIVGSDAPAEKPTIGPMRNQVVELGAFGIQKTPTLGAQHAPAGMTFVVVDLRAKSLIRDRVRASDFRPQAKPTETMEVGTVADWKESRKYAQLVADGEYAYLPLAASTLTEEPRFLPDIFTGGTLVFLAPQQATSLELRCDFPNAKLTDGKIIRPDGLTLPLEGKRPPLPSRKAIASAKDDIFEMDVFGQTTPAQVAGLEPGEGWRFLALDVTVRNAGGKQQEFFQPTEQLKYTAESAKQTEADPVTGEVVHRPGVLIYIPPGERRTFQMVYRIPATDTRPRLAYASVSEGGGKVLTLQPISKSVAQAAQPDEAPAPPPQPVAPQPAPKPPEMQVATGNSGQPALPPTVVQRPKPTPAPHKTGAEEAPRVAAKQDRKPLGIEGVGLTAQQVNAAIDKGAAGLWAYLRAKDLRPDNEGRLRPMGDNETHVLCALALVHAEAHEKIPEFDAALRQYMAKAQPRHMGVYQAGLFAMLVEAYGDAAYVPKLREAARYLMESQGKTGTWIYTPSVPDPVFVAAAEGKGQVLRVEGGTQLDEPTKPWDRLTKRPEHEGDNSVTQYGLLGLMSASRAGMKMPPDAWQLPLKTTYKRQNSDGGWGYHDASSSSYGSMTCAGICAVAITRYESGEQDPFVDPALERGLGWLAANFSVTAHPKQSNGDNWYYYYLYSLERVGRILDTEFISEHEWYPAGAKTLIDKQRPDGTWIGKTEEADPRIASSFALLFLTRATPPIALSPHRGGQGTLTAIAKPPPNRLYIILDASGSMLEEMDGRMKFDLAKGAVWSLVKDLPEGSEVALRVYGHRKRAIDKDADEDTQLLIPMEPLKRDAFKAKLDALRSRGKTPLALSLEESLAELRDADAKEPVTLVLLTDGGEDTRPRRDPVKAAAALAQHPNVHFHLVGFDINQADWSTQLQAMADASHGSYWPAVKAADLERSLKAAVLGTPDGYDVLDPSGKTIARAVFGQKVALPEGQYTFRTALAGRSFTQKLWVNTEATTAVEFDGKAALDSAATAAPATPAPTATATPTPAPQTSPPAPAPAAGAKKFCTKCGAPLKPGQKFCSNCGARANE